MRKRRVGFSVIVLSLVMLLGAALGDGAQAASEVNGTQPPMVTKHLLVPESNPSDTAKVQGVNTTRVIFTGVMGTADGKKALLDTGSAPKEGASSAAWYKEGDTVGPYVLKEISANAIVLEGSGESLRLPLYGPEKERPQPVELAAGPLSKGQVAEKPAPEGAAQEQGQGQPPNPFGPAPNKVTPGKGATPPGQAQPQGGGANPFQEAIEKARQGKGTGQGSGQGPFPPPAQGSGSGSNPLMNILKKQQQ